MKDFPDSAAENLLDDLRGGAIQSLATTGVSITLVISIGSEMFEIGSLGEVKLENGGLDSKDLFSCSIEELSPLATSLVTNVFADGERVILQTENPSSAVTFERGIDYAVEITKVAKTKGPAFFFG